VLPPAADGPQQKYAATLLNEVCGEEGCQFIVGMGDNFYPCGADAFESGLNRFASGELLSLIKMQYV